MTKKDFIPLFLALALALSGCADKAASVRVLWPPPPNKPYLEWIGTYASRGDLQKQGFSKVSEKLIGKDAEPVLKTPFGVASPGNGIVYISDIHLKNVAIFDLNKGLVEMLSAGSVFDLPLGMAVDSAGNLYVADGGYANVKVFSPDRKPLFSFGSKKEFDKPAFLAINERLKRIYVSDAIGSRIVVFDMAGKHLFSFGSKGNREGEFYSPQGLAVDSQDRLFVADMFNARVQVFDADGKFKYTFGKRGDQFGQFEMPKGLAFDGSDNLYLVDSRRPYIQTYSPDGQLLLVTGSAQRTSQKLGFVIPSAVSIDRNDRIYVSDPLNKRVSVWQFLTEAYLKENPVTEENIEAYEKFKKEQEVADKKTEEEGKTKVAPLGE